MTRETRLNLWFLAIFLVISLPGAVILFNKKLDPAASRMDEPDAVLSQLPYMAPVPAPPETRWRVPTTTRQWLADLTRRKTGKAMASAVPAGPEWEPVISADHRLQVMSVSSANGTARLALIVWETLQSDDVSQFKVEVRAAGHDLAATIAAKERVEVPQTVRHELVALGYAHPPTRVSWMQAKVQGALNAGADATINLSCDGPTPLRTSVSWKIR